MAKECKVLFVGKDLLHKPISKLINDTSAEHQRGLNITERVMTSLKNAFYERH